MKKIFETGNYCIDCGASLTGYDRDVPLCDKCLARTKYTIPDKIEIFSVNDMW